MSPWEVKGFQLIKNAGIFYCRSFNSVFKRAGHIIIIIIIIIVMFTLLTSVRNIRSDNLNILPYFPVDNAHRCITRTPNFFDIPFDV
jgi:hypothetical protein